MAHESFEFGQGKNARRVPSDPWNVMSDTEGTKQRRQSLRASNASASRKRSRNTLREKKTEKPAAPVDDSAWIHRDKLAEIEIQEMQAAGIDVRPYRRSMSAGQGATARSSRSQSRSRRQSKDRGSDHTAEEYNMSYPGYDEYEWKRVSTIPAADDEEREFDPTIDTEFRTPEEVARAGQGSPSTHIIRPSTSRIPVSKASPVPVPQTVSNRDSPLPRSRGNSAAGSGNWDELLYARKARSGSIGSQAILDDEDSLHTPPRPGSSILKSSENSPPKARVPNKSAPASGGRNSASNGVQSPTSTSYPRTSSSNQRPTSRSGPPGHKSRPSTSHQHAPEGDPPWIASMYKPDPRLPPDQQMLPTHAKRMMQEQWEKEGKPSSSYDREFRPINDDELPTKKPSPPSTSVQSPTQPLELDASQPLPSPDQMNNGLSPNSVNMNAWPLTPKSETRSDLSSPRPGTSGGYKITPTIATPAAIEKSPTASNRAFGQPHNPTRRIPDLDEKDEAHSKKKGGCACCVVM